MTNSLKQSLQETQETKPEEIQERIRIQTNQSLSNLRSNV